MIVKELKASIIERALIRGDIDVFPSPLAMSNPSVLQTELS